MSRHERLEKLLRAAFPSAVFQVFDDSKAHAGHGHGFHGETHYRLHIVEESFRDQPLIQIHRKILAAVKPETDAGMHSFVIEKATPPTQPPPLPRGEVPKAEGGRIS